MTSRAAEAIKAMYPLAPYAVVLAALYAAWAGAPNEAWMGLMLSGAALIKPDHGQ